MTGCLVSERFKELQAAAPDYHVVVIEGEGQGREGVDRVVCLAH